MLIGLTNNDEKVASFKTDAPFKITVQNQTLLMIKMAKINSLFMTTPLRATQNLQYMYIAHILVNFDLIFLMTY